MDKIAGAHTAARGADCGGDAESGAEPLREGAERVEAGQGELAETRDDAGHPQDLFGRTGGEAPRGTTGRIRVHGDEVGVKIVCFRADDGLSVRAGNVVKTMRLPRIDLSNLEVAHAVVAVALTEVGVPPVSRRTAHERNTLHLDDEDVGAVNAVRAERAGNRRCHRLARLSGDALLERGDVGQADGCSSRPRMMRPPSGMFPKAQRVGPSEGQPSRADFTSIVVESPPHRRRAAMSAGRSRLSDIQPC